jgi:hypothetical protein
MSIELMRSLYGEQTLADMGDKLSAQLSELSARPTRDGCDRMVRELAEASTAVARLRMKLERAEAA